MQPSATVRSRGQSLRVRAQLGARLPLTTAQASLRHTSLLSTSPPVPADRTEGGEREDRSRSCTAQGPRGQGLGSHFIKRTGAPLTPFGNRECSPNPWALLCPAALRTDPKERTDTVPGLRVLPLPFSQLALILSYWGPCWGQTWCSCMSWEVARGRFLWGLSGV